MNWYELLHFIAYFDFKYGALNVLGAFWFLVLIIVASRRFIPQFRVYLPQPPGKKKIFWWVAILCFAYATIFLAQQIFDDFITWPLGILTGAWSLLEPSLGPMTVFKLFAIKWDVYLTIAMSLFIFTYYGLWRFFQFTKWSLFWSTLVIVFSIYLAVNGQWNYRIQYVDHTIPFWLTYPESRIMTGFLISSVIKKPGKNFVGRPLWGLRFGG